MRVSIGTNVKDGPWGEKFICYQSDKLSKRI